MISGPWVDGLTIGQVLRETARRFGPREALVFRQANVHLTWQQSDEAVDQTARGLLGLGIEPGDHFGVWSSNLLPWVLLQFATARIGAVVVTINPGYQTAELQYALAQSDVCGLAVSDRYRSSNLFAILRKEGPCRASIGGVCGKLYFGWTGEVGGREPGVRCG